MSLRTSCAGILALVGAGLLAAPASANLIVNGDFQTGDANGWTALKPGTTVVANAGPAGAGDYALRINGNDWTYPTEANGFGVIGENGKTYTVSFDVKVDPTKANNTDLYFQKAWGGNYPAYNFMAHAAELADGQWHTITWSFTTDAGGFKMGLANGGNASRDIYLDNIQVSVPEPASMAVLGLASLTVLRRRRSA